MNIKFSHAELYNELESFLLTSTVAKRKMWASAIVENNVDIKNLSRLLKCEQKVATRFLWLLSEIGELDPKKLLIELPFLLDLCDSLNPDFKKSFAIFWLIAGVPSENEGKAIDLLFEWLLSAYTNVTIKSRSLLVLLNLSKKYPELKNELALCLKDQIGKHTIVFDKRATKILMKMEQENVMRECENGRM